MIENLNKIVSNIVRNDPQSNHNITTITYNELSQVAKTQVLHVSQSILTQLELYIYNMLSRPAKYIESISKILFPEKMAYSIYNQPNFASHLVSELVFLAANNAIYIGVVEHDWTIFEAPASQPFVSQLLSISENSDSYLIVTYKAPDMQNDADTSPMPTNIIEQTTQQQTNLSNLTSNLRKNQQQS